MVLILTYFDGRGLAELIRLLFKYGDIEFIDNRISKDKWPELKASTPFGQLPILENNGEIIWQSGAIAKYAAKLVNLAGNNPWEDAQIDAVVETLTELRTKLFEFLNEHDEERKERIKDDIISSGTISECLSRLEDIAKKNNGHLALNRLTWADFYLVSMFDFLARFKGEPLCLIYDNLNKIVADVESIPNVKKWIETRPKTDF